MPKAPTAGIRTRDLRMSGNATLVTTRLPCPRIPFRRVFGSWVATDNIQQGASRCRTRNRPRHASGSWIESRSDVEVQRPVCSMTKRQIFYLSPVSISNASGFNEFNANRLGFLEIVEAFECPLHNSFFYFSDTDQEKIDAWSTCPGVADWSTCS